MEQKEWWMQDEIDSLYFILGRKGRSALVLDERVTRDRGPVKSNEDVLRRVKNNRKTRNDSFGKVVGNNWTTKNKRNYMKGWQV